MGVNITFSHLIMVPNQILTRQLEKVLRVKSYGFEIRVRWWSAQGTSLPYTICFRSLREWFQSLDLGLQHPPHDILHILRSPQK